jgi:hypothetical protein
VTVQEGRTAPREAGGLRQRLLHVWNFNQAAVRESYFAYPARLEAKTTHHFQSQVYSYEAFGQLPELHTLLGQLSTAIIMHLSLVSDITSVGLSATVSCTPIQLES